MNDYQSQFKSIEEFLKETSAKIFSKIDQLTFKMLVNCLKSNDYYVVADAIDQLVKEKKPLAIAPLYLVYSRHPNENIRAKAKQALDKLDPNGQVLELTKDKSTEQAVADLVKEYGHFAR